MGPICPLSQLLYGTIRLILVVMHVDLKIALPSYVKETSPSILLQYVRCKLILFLFSGGVTFRGSLPSSSQEKVARKMLRMFNLAALTLLPLLLPL